MTPEQGQPDTYRRRSPERRPLKTTLDAGYCILYTELFVKGLPQTQPTKINYAAQPTRTVGSCTGWAEHGHRERYLRSSARQATPVAEMTEDQRETARAQRRHVIESNKAWQAATTVRRAWLTTFATRKTPPAGAEAYLAQAISERRDHQVGAHELVKLTPAEVTHELAAAIPKRALHLALVLTVASWEQSTTKDTWRQSYNEHVAAATLTALRDWGYDLSDIEARVVAGTSREAV